MGIVGGALAMALLVVFAISYCRVFWVEPSYPEAPSSVVSEPRPISTPFISPGWRQPPLTPAHDALIPDGDDVIGLVVAATPRAYHLRSMNAISRCVINDVIQETPVTVTFDRHHDRVQVWTRRGTREPLPIEIGGLFQGRLLLRLEGRFFFQADGRVMDGLDDAPGLDLQSVPFQRVDWRTWRQRHPQTMVVFVPSE
jgi:hypothetical protein